MKVYNNPAIQSCVSYLCDDTNVAHLLYFFNLEIINTNSGCPVCLGEGADTVDKPGETSKEGQ